MDDPDLTVHRDGEPADDSFEGAIDAYNRALTEALRRGTDHPVVADFLDRVRTERRRGLFHQLQRDRLYLVIRNTGERLRVEAVAAEYRDPPVTDAERLDLLRTEADARVLADGRETPESVRADLCFRFPSLADRLDGAFLDGLRTTQRDGGPPDPPGYALLYRIGGGGQAAIWLARDLKSGVTVAVKAINIQNPFGGSTDTLRKEAERLRRMLHTNIVRVHNYTEHGGYALLVMDYIAGGTLRSRRGLAAWPLVEAIETVATLAEAIQFAHEAGVLHLDLKPDNVMIARNGPGHDTSAPRVVDGTLQLVDWGMFRVRGEDGRSAPYGTPVHMAPEQALGEDPGPRTDVWGLGAILYQLLVCRPLYDAPTAVAALVLARNASYTHPRELDGTIPEDVEACLLRALAPVPAGRYSSAQAFATDLRTLAAKYRAAVPTPREPATPKPVAPRHRRPLAAAVAVVAALGVLGAGVWTNSTDLFRTKPDARAEAKDRGPAAPEPTPVRKIEGPPVPPAPVEPPFEIEYRGIAYSARNPKQPLVLTNPIELFTGDQFRFHAKVKRDCHVYVVNEDPKRELALLCPHPEVAPSSRFKGGSEVRLPGAGQRWFTLEKVTGLESLFLIACPKPISVLEEWAATPEPPPELLKRVREELTTLRVGFRTVVVKPKAPALIPPGDDPAVEWEAAQAERSGGASEVLVKVWEIVHRPRP